MKRFGTKLYIIASKANPNLFLKIEKKTRSFTKGASKHQYMVGHDYTLFTEYEKKKLFAQSQDYIVVKVY